MKNPLEPLRKIMTVLSGRADEASNARDTRKMAAIVAKGLKGVDKIAQIGALADTARMHADETGSWVTYSEFRDDGKTGPFDACDLRHWLRIARLAGVDVVPAVEVASFDEEEYAAAVGVVELPDTATTRAAIGGLRDAAHEILDKLDAGGEMEEEDERAMEFAASMLRPPIVDKDALREKLFAALDNVPEGWMVRNVRVGPSNLKALAGSGAIGGSIPEVRFGPDVETGPGWIRHGNRRRLSIDDHRTVQAVAQGPNGGTSFVARPWIPSARHFMADDPNRRETPLKGPGVWPAEWRAFVEDGEVVGVSFYYSWVGEPTPENAVMAMETRRLAQKIVDKASELGMWPRYMDIEFVRSSRAERIINDKGVQDHLTRFGREKVACTLDFIETAEGLKLLEGGPANTPFGGGHPCGFAGAGGQPFHGQKTETEGVAFRNMEHVIIAEPKTWIDGDRSGCIMSWAEVAELAANHDVTKTPALK